MEADSIPITWTASAQHEGLATTNKGANRTIEQERHRTEAHVGSSRNPGAKGMEGMAPSRGSGARSPVSGRVSVGLGQVSKFRGLGDSTLEPELLKEHRCWYDSCRDRSPKKPRGSPQEDCGLGVSFFSEPTGSSEWLSGQAAQAAACRPAQHHRPRRRARS